jgi:hypothetical protein
MKRLTIVATVIAALLALPSVAAAKDRDHDKLPDRWEKQNGLSTTKNSARGDLDKDGLTNLQEFRCHTKPRVADSNHNGVSDADEDPDRDGVDNGNEMAEGTRPFDRDSDNDGTRDGREDPDRDRLVNAAEDATSNSPVNPDTDGDGVKDGSEHAGTIVSFEGGVLIIDLANGDRVTGTVTAATEIDCQSEDSHDGSDQSHHGNQTVAHDAGDGPSGESDGEAGNNDNGDAGNHDQGDQGDHHDGNVDDGDNETDDEGVSTCGPADLKAGVAVHEAELRAGADGLAFSQIELVK